MTEVVETSEAPAESAPVEDGIIRFDRTGVNMLALGDGGLLKFNWAPPKLAIDQTFRINDALLGLDIPFVDVGVDVRIRANASLNFELAFDVGTVDIDYDIVRPEFVGNFGTRTVQYMGETIEMPWFSFVNPVLRPGGVVVDGQTVGAIGFHDGMLTPHPGEPENSYISITRDHDIYVGIGNATAVVDYLAGSETFTIIGGMQELFANADSRVIFSKNLAIDGKGNLLGEPDLTQPFYGALYIPRLVGQWGTLDADGKLIDKFDDETTIGSGLFPTLSKEGDAVAPTKTGGFFEATLDIDNTISKIFGLPPLTGSKTLVGTESDKDVWVDYSLINADLNVGVQASQGLRFVVEGVSMAGTAYFTKYDPQTDLPLQGVDQRIKGSTFDQLISEGNLPDFTFDTPMGEGVMELDVTYTLHGHYVSEAGIKIVGHLAVSGLALTLHNRIGPDFDAGVGPLFSLQIPDPQFETDRINLYEKTQNIDVTAKDTYHVFYGKEVIGTEKDDKGVDALVALSGQDDPTKEPPPEIGSWPLPIHGYRGDDEVFGNEFNNELWGDEGDDFIKGGDGNDDLIGGLGDDIIFGQNGGDTLDGGDGNDVLDAGVLDEGANFIFGGSGDDQIIGGGGDDYIDTGMGSDEAFGGDGDDSVYYSNLDGTDIISGGSRFQGQYYDNPADVDLVSINIETSNAAQTFDFDADFTLSDGTRVHGFETLFFFGGFGADNVRGGALDDLLHGGGGDDVLDARAGGEDSIYGGVGDDVVKLRGGVGKDLVDGGKGADTLDLAFTQNDVTSIDIEAATIVLADGTEIEGFERLTFTAIGVTDDLTVRGGTLNDSIVGGSGDDLLDGEGGLNTINGFSGEDVVISQGPGDTVRGGADDDTLILFRTETKIGLQLDLSFDGVEDLDFWTRTLSDSTVVGDVERIQFFGGDGKDDIRGGRLDGDVLRGFGGADTLDGGAGDDLVDGMDGNDVLVMQSSGRARGGAGGGVIQVADVDRADGGAGNDRLKADYSDVTEGLFLDLTTGAGELPGSTDQVSSFKDMEIFEIRTGSGNDYIVGGDYDTPNPAPLLVPALGGFGDVPITPAVFGPANPWNGDVIRTGGGDDTVDGGRGNDIIDTGAGSDTVYLSRGVDQINAGGDRGLGRGSSIDTLVVDIARFDGLDQLKLSFLTLASAVAPDANGDGDTTDDEDQAAAVTTLGTGTKIVGFERLDYTGGSLIETISGAEFDDFIFTAAGADSLFGKGGDDYLSGGEGSDDIVGADGNDFLDGGRFNDTPVGATSAPDYDDLSGGAGDDVVRIWLNGEADGGLGVDRLTINIRMTDASDTFGFVAGAAETVFRGLTYRGFETLSASVADGSSVGGTIVAAGGDDILAGDVLDDVLDGKTGIDRLLGFDGDDILLFTYDGLARGGPFGGGGNDVGGGRGNDAPSDEAFGGEGYDTLVLAYGAATEDLVLRWRPTPPVLPGQPAPPAHEGPTASGIERYQVTTGSGDDLYEGSEARDEITAGAGNDTLRLGAGADVGLGGDGDDLIVDDGVGFGQVEADLMSGGMGNDELRGGQGAETMNGGVGNDLVVNLDQTFYGLTSAWGRDALRGNDGDDVVRSNAPGVFDGGAGFDRLDLGVLLRSNAAGRAVWDLSDPDAVLTVVEGFSITGFERYDLAFGNLNDTVTVGLERHVLDGGGGNDTLVVLLGAFDAVPTSNTVGNTTTFSNGMVAIGFEQIEFRLRPTYLTEEADGYVSGLGNHLVYALGGDDVLVGGPGSQGLYGEGGNDRLDGGGGSDILDGGEGIDTVDYRDRIESVVLTLTGADGAIAFVNGAEEDLVRSVERIVGGSANDTLTGDDTANEIDGSSGDDLLKGNGGLDALRGGPGFDIADYRDVVSAVTVTLHGSDPAFVSSGAGIADQLFNVEGIYGGASDDTVTGDERDNLLRGGAGVDSFDGGAGQDVIDFSDKSGDLVLTLAGATLVTASVGGVDEDTLKNVEGVYGGSGSDTVTGDAFDNVFRGGAGIDAFEGGAGSDLIDFSDKTAGVVVTLNGATLVFAVAGGSLEDSFRNVEGVRGGSGADTFTGDAQDNRLEGAAGDDVLLGGMGRDVLEGGRGADTLNGGSSDDVMRGGGGDDVYTVDTVGDVVDETGGGGIDLVKTLIAYTLPEGVENLTLIAGLRGTGNGLANAIKGSGGDDRLEGLGGSDSLYGGQGKDLLVGGAGRDAFIWKSKSESSTDLAQSDRILDFSRAARDHIMLRDIDAVEGTPGNDTFLFIENGGAFQSGQAGRIRVVYDELSKTAIVQGETTGDGVADFQIVVENLTGTLFAGDFVL